MRTRWSLLAIAAIAALPLNGRAAETGCGSVDPPGVAHNQDLALTVQPATAWRPRDGEVRFDIAGKAGVKDVLVCFAWPADLAHGQKSPRVRLLSLAEQATDASNSVSFGALVPNLPPVSDGWLSRAWYNTREAVGLAIVPVATMIVTVETANGMQETFVETIGVTSVSGAVGLVFGLVAVFYLTLRVLARRAEAPQRGVLGPLLWLITAADGFASLSQFQTMVWTAAVALSATYVMALSGNLLNVPDQMLALLGIAGGASVIARVPPKQGLRQAPRPADQPSGWSDLVVIGGKLDVTRVQMLLFTLVTAAFVILKVVVSYEIPDIPANFVLLMGLSNSVYLAGRHIPDTATPNQG